MINQIILAYVRITCYAVLYCMSMLIAALLSGSVKKEAKQKLDDMYELQKQIDIEADKLNEE